MKRSVRCLTVLSTLLGASFAHAKELPNFDAYYQAKPAPTRVLSSNTNRRISVVSTDARTGAPTFFWAPRAKHQVKTLLSKPKATPELSAKKALEDVAVDLTLPKGVIAGTFVREIHDRGEGGLVVRLGQTVNGIEVFRGRANVILDRNHELIAASQNLHPAAISGSKSVPTNFATTAEEALASALHNLREIDVPLGKFIPKGQKGAFSYLDLELTEGVRLAAPARVKKVYFGMPDRLIPAWFVEMRTIAEGERDPDAYDYVISAEDGSVLYRQNLTMKAAFNYRVWADASGDKRPLDGPQADYTPHPTGTPDGSSPAFIAPTLVSMDGFNKNPQGTFDPWLAEGATQTKGNNVDAYVDQYGQDGFDAQDIRATTSSPGNFDRTYDISQGPTANNNQKMASITQLFYVTNWLHDYWYDSGFDEAAGNAQQVNFGRGGVEGDPLHAEAQDSAFSTSQLDHNNANMAAMTDGESPIMQMYTWTGVDGKVSLQVSPGNISITNLGVAQFGPDTFNTPGALILADDQSGTVTDACQSIKNNVAGKIVLVDRGNCTFKLKAVNVQAAGGIGMLLADNAPNTTAPGMPDDPNTPTNVTIPILSVTQADGAVLKQSLGTGAVNVTMSKTGAMRDGSIDNMIVSHEWGHYIHLRLVTGCGNKICGAMSEGWGDFLAFHTALREGDNLDGTYGLGTYATATFGDSGYYGVRRLPYSVDMTKNGLTYKHVVAGAQLPNPEAIDLGDMTETHNAGEIWAQMLFESLVGLLKRSQQPGAPYDFEGARRRMADYVVAGMKAAPIDPTYLEQRDAILAAAAARDVEDLKIMAGAFAKRGAGSCAVSPPRDSQDNVGLVESFEVKAAMSDLGGELDDSVQSCDGDGYLDAQEKGHVTVELVNTGVADLTDAVGTVSVNSPGVSFPNGTTVNFGTIAPFATGKVTVDIELDQSVTTLEATQLTIEVTSAQTCTTKKTFLDLRYINVDDVPSSSTTESVESRIDAWTKSSDSQGEYWTREVDAAPNHVWHGAEVDIANTASLESPEITAGSAPVTLTLKHRFAFEMAQGGGPAVPADGAVIEISTNNGQSWQDITQFAPSPYNGTITTQSDNPLGGRPGFINKNAGNPGYTTTTINLGTSLANQSFKVRFRIATDSGNSTAVSGWDIDEISVEGATNKPFPSIVADQNTCAGLPTADAGTDLVVTSGDTVKLDGTGSSDPDGDTLSFTWTQSDGTAVMLNQPETATPTFVAPVVTADTVLTFDLKVSDGKGSAGDQMKVTVKPRGAETGSGGSGGTLDVGDDGGCGCSVVGEESKSPVVPAAALGLLGAIVARLRRRKSS